jgi:flagellin-like protein
MAFKNLKMLKSRKGISPILATLLLIVIAVAAISVTYAWIMTYTDSTTEKAGVMLYKANVLFNSTTTDTITIDIGNSGTSAATLSKIYIGTSATAVADQGTLSNTALAAGGIISNTFTYDFDSGDMYYFKVVPTTGNPLEFNERAP